MKLKLISIAFAVLVPTLASQAYQDGTSEVTGFIINTIIDPVPVQSQPLAQPSRRETAGAVQLGIEPIDPIDEMVPVEPIEPIEPVADDSTELKEVKLP